MLPQTHAPVALWAVCGRLGRKQQSCLMLADARQEVEHFPFKINVNCTSNGSRRGGYIYIPYIYIINII